MTSEASNPATKSALQDNIESKGKNAYYFAHAHKANGPKWDGRPEPRLLAKHSDHSADDESTSINDNANMEQNISNHAQSLIKSLKGKKSSFNFSKSNITKYAFIDEGKKVKIYIDLVGVGDVCNAEEDVKLDWDERSFSLQVFNYSAVGVEKGEAEAEAEAEAETLADSSGVKCLSFGRLHGFISKAAARVKKDRIILTLTKKVDEGKDPEDWPQIAQKGDSEHEVV